MNNKTASKELILEGIEYLKQDFTNRMNMQVQEIDTEYTELKTRGYLTSANIDSIIMEIKGKINNLKEDFESVSAQITRDLQTTSEILESGQRGIESTL